MKISFFLILLFFCTQMFWAQRTLFNQKYQSLAQDFQLSQEQLDAYRGEGRLEIFNEVKHKTSLTEKLIKANVGKTIKFNRGYEVVKFRVLAKSMLPHYRVRYIFINKNKFDDQEHFDAYLNKVRDLLSKTEFESVAMQYSMDYKKGIGGDSGWFKQGKTHPVFFEEVTMSNRLAQQIFEFEIPASNWYYIVKKTHAEIDIEEVLALELKQE